MYKIMYFFTIFLCIFIYSCGRIPVDKTPAPIDNNLWTLEMSTSENTDVGLIGVSYYRSEGAEEYVDIPLIGKGTLTIRSQRCLYENVQTYDVGDWAIRRFSISDLVAKVPSSEFACIFNIVMFVEGLDKGFQGQLYVQIKEQDELPLKFTLNGKNFTNIGWYQFRQGSTFANDISFALGKPGKLLVAGCGRDLEIPFQGDLTLPLRDLIGTPRLPGCVYTIGAQYNDGTIAIAELNLKVFSESVVSLPDPALEYENERLKVTADPVVAYLGIDDYFKKKNQLSRKVKKDETALVRLMTANGRYKLLGVKNGEIVWTSSVQY